MTDQIAELFESSFGEFLSRESANILTGISERSLCTRLSIYMDRLRQKLGLEKYFVDTEYNRNGGRIKTILDDQMREVVINCDLVLHSRGQVAKRDNLITIEMKKAGRPEEEKERDRE